MWVGWLEIQPLENLEEEGEGGYLYQERLPAVSDSSVSG